MSDSGILHSPDGKYSIEPHDDFGEIAMGSPSFGHITLRGTDGPLPDNLYGRTFLFSPDSRFVALEELVGARQFSTKLIVVELPHCKIFVVRLQEQGTATPLRWDSPHRLLFTTWSVGLPRETEQWDAPPPPPTPKRSCFSLWK